MKCSFCKNDAIRIVENLENELVRAACKEHLLDCLREGRLLIVTDVNTEGSSASRRRWALENAYPELLKKG
jgi:hypothetical protein